MPDSKKRQRQIEKQPLKELKREARRTVLFVSLEYGQPLASEVLRLVANEVFRYGDSDCPGFAQAPLPSDRGDLRKEYARRRLDDFQGTHPDEVIQQVLLTPQGQAGPGPRRSAISHQPSAARTRRAFRSLHARKGRHTT